MRDMKGLLTSCVILLLAACGLSSPDPEELLIRANQSLEQGDYRSAVTDFKTILQSQPDNFVVRKSLGKLYLNMNLVAAAKKELSEALKLSPGDADIYPLLSKSLLLTNDEKRLTNLALPASLNNKQKSLINAYQAIALLKIGEPGAKLLLDRALSLDSENSEALLGLAMEKSLNGDITSAKSWLEKALAFDSGDEFRLWNYLGYLETLDGDYSAAEEAYTKAIEIGYVPDSSYMNRSLVRLYLGDLNGAQDDFSKLGKDWKSQPQAIFNQGMIAYEEKKYQESANYFEEVLAVQKDYMPALLYAGSANHLLGNREIADNYLSKYIDKNASDLNAKSMLASTRLYAGDAVSAEHLVNDVLAVNRQDIFALEVLADSYRVRNMHSKHVDVRRKIAQLEPDLENRKIQLAIALLESGDQEQAVMVLERQLATSPESEVTRRQLLLTYRQTGQFSEALAIAKELKRMNPDSVDPILLEGMLFMDQQDFSSAEEAFSEVIDLASDNTSAYSGLAAVAIARGNLSRAEEIYQTSLKFQPEHLDTLINLASIQMKSDQNDVAVVTLEKAVESHPDTVSPRLRLARLYKQLGEYEKVISLIEAAQDQTNLFLISELAEAQLKVQNFSAAKSLLETFVAQAPDDAKARYSLAMIYGREGDFRGYQQEITTAYRLDPNGIDILKEKISIDIKAGDLNNARGNLKRLEEKIGGRSDWISLKAEIATASGDDEGALSLYARAFSEDKNNQNLIRYTNALWQEGETEKAVELMESWLQNHPEDPVVIFDLANRYLMLKDNDQAIVNFRRLVTLGVNNVLVMNNLAWLLRDRSPEEAEKYAYQAVGMAPSSASIQDTYAIVLLARGKVEKAKFAIDRAKMLEPESATIGYHRAVILDRSGEFDDAKAELLSVLEKSDSFPYRQEAEQLLEKLGDG